MRPILIACPSCGGQLGISRMVCPECRISIEGDFSIPGIFRLNRAQIDFVEVFLKNRGVIREVERELGVSYPTVRARLDDVVKAMGFQGRDGELDRSGETRRREILEQLGEGKLTAEQAFEQLRSDSSKEGDEDD